MLAFGTGSTWRKDDPEAVNTELTDIVKEALLSGYRHLDTAEREYLQRSRWGCG